MGGAQSQMRSSAVKLGDSRGSRRANSILKREAGHSRAYAARRRIPASEIVRHSPHYARSGGENFTTAIYR